MLKSRARKAFNRAAETYTAAADVQRRIAVSLASRLALDTPPKLIVDAGCGTGFALPLLRQTAPQATLVAIDFAERMLSRLADAEGADSPTAHPLCGDLEHLPLADACADLYWSSLTLQWCALPAALRESRRVLRPGGRLAFATVTSETFHELRAAFEGIDGYARVLDFLSPEAIAAAVAEAGFPRACISRDRIRTTYPDLKSLLRAVRQVGAGAVAGDRRQGLFGKDSWRSVEARYARFREGSRCPLTYDVLYVTASA